MITVVNRLGARGPWLAAVLAMLALVAAWLLLSRGEAQAQRPAAKASGSLTAFRSDAELRRFLRRARGEVGAMYSNAEPMPSPPAAAQDSMGEVVVTASGARAPSITNTQEADVDEGGIVKQSGDTLVILRRGRLFTVSTADGGMRPIDSIDAYPPGVSGRDSWYDEMLLHGDRVIVVGYSYDRGGTEINRFRLSPDGRLRFEDAWHLKSNDYYSSRNYASRLIGNRLIFYTPLALDWDEDPLEALPGLRKWRPGQDEDTPFRRIASARQIFIAPTMRNDREAELDTLHSVTDCDLTAAELRCSAVGVIGPESRTFYVSGGAVYLWVSEWTNRDRRRGEPEAFLYRLPLGRERPSAIGVRGAPVDQFSFREDRADGMLNVLVREEGGGDAMGNPEVSGGRVALLRLPIGDFGDGSELAAGAHYRRLPSLPEDSWSFRNRFVGDHVLYGGGAFGEDEKRAALVVAPVRGGRIAQLEVGHAVERIEVLGRDALVVGGGPEDGLGFTAVELPERAQPRLGDVFTLPAASEGESRSHAFFFRPSTADGASGILGLPVARAAEPAYQRFFGSAAAMLFLRRDQRRFAPAGELGAEVRGVIEDDCQASCTDWYGNARPIFLGDRIFALLGYELVEGRLNDGRIREIGRVNFAPRPRPARD
jgi:Beta propeller domain